jgi:hypothetical protein
LDPVEFQKEIERRTAEEKTKMDEFKAHEEKMKQFREAKRRQLDPVRKESTSNVENQPPPA